MFHHRNYHLLTLLPSKENLVMVGDTIYDVKGAAYHGIPCVAVTWGYGIVEEMQNAGATIVGSMNELYNAL